MRGLLALVAIEVGTPRAASRARTGSVTLKPTDLVVEQLRKLVEERYFHAQRQLNCLLRRPSRHDGGSSSTTT